MGFFCYKFDYVNNLLITLQKPSERIDCNMGKTDLYIEPFWTKRFQSVKCGFTLPALGNQALTRKSISSGKTTKENREQLGKLLGKGLESIFSPHQIHGDTVVDVTLEELGKGAYSLENSLQGDACITGYKDVVLITTWADCIPVILFDPAAGLAATIHSGWRSSRLNITNKTIKMLQERGAEPARLMAAIGPGIRGCCYRVGFDFMEHFKDDIYRDCFRELGDELYFDLSTVVYRQLLQSGLKRENIDFTGSCTCCSGDPSFFSCRKDGAEHFEGQAAFIMLF